MVQTYEDTGEPGVTESVFSTRGVENGCNERRSERGRVDGRRSGTDFPERLGVSRQRSVGAESQWRRARTEEDRTWWTSEVGKEYK